jgi:nucleotide-binding universal stress UspA family protein
VSARLLVLVMPGQEGAALAGLATLVATARGERAHIRIACFQPLPPSREDRHGRIVAGTDREMDRITRTTAEAFAAAARGFVDVSIECVVRFGRPRREARVETEVWEPDIVASFEGRGPLGTIRYLVTGARRRAASASAASRATSSPAFWRRAMRTP